LAPGQLKATSSLLSHTPAMYFSDFFNKRDKAEFEAYTFGLNMDWRYTRVMDSWKKPLLRKQRRRERLLSEKLLEKRLDPEPEKFVVHNPAVGLRFPIQENEIFAVVQIGGSQYKVVKDDVVVAEKIDDVDINQQIVLDKVYLIGTKDYTSIGRPVVASAKVYATVEEQCLTDKIIVFKKKRRKNYKRNRGHRQEVTVLRIDKVEHNVEPDTLQKAVSLV